MLAVNYYVVFSYKNNRIEQNDTQPSSRTLNEAEQNYNTIYRECLPVFSAVLKLHPHLEGHELTIRTDPDALNWIFNLADTAGKLAGW